MLPGKLVRFCKWILGLLGFGASVSSCIFPVMYGSPYMTWSVKGKVVDAQGKPIEGIQVADADHFHTDDRVFTDASGNFVFGPYERDNVFGSIDLWFDDMDLEESGGYFARQKVTFNLIQVERGHGSWNQGTYENESDFVLTMVPDTEEHDWYSTMHIIGSVYDAAKNSNGGRSYLAGVKAVLENRIDSCYTDNYGSFQFDWKASGSVAPSQVNVIFTSESYRDTTITFTMTKNHEGTEYWELGDWRNYDNYGVYLKKKD